MIGYWLAIYILSFLMRAPCMLILSECIKVIMSMKLGSKLLQAVPKPEILAALPISYHKFRMKLMPNATEISFYIDTLLVETVLAEPALYKRASVMSDILSRVKEYFASK